MLSRYRGARVLVTGHTGFKGRHLLQALRNLGAEVGGFSLPNDDVRNLPRLVQYVDRLRPRFVFHLAAQAFVPRGYEDPITTFSTNTIGTANVLEALRLAGRPCAVVIVTTDKVYVPKSSPHVEEDPLGGRDPYSASKAAAEAVVTAYRDGFFAPTHEIAVATARAGNVIGTGDFGLGRLVPNCARALRAGEPIQAWNPNAVRPWQHVEDVIDGYMLLGAALAGKSRGFYCVPWNFGPGRHATVKEVIEEVIHAWGSGTWEHQPTTLREVADLRIDSTKARMMLGWCPKWSFEEMIAKTIRWYKGAL